MDWSEKLVLQTRAVVLFLLASVVALSPALWAGDPLVFVDSVSYYRTGGRALEYVWEVLAQAVPGNAVAGNLSGNIAESSAGTIENTMGLRSLPYSIFLNVLIRSLGEFGPLIVVSGITTWLLMLFTQPLAASGRWQRQWLVVLGVTAGTTLPFYTAQYMPDVFAGWLIAIPMILVVRSDLSRRVRFLLLLLMGFSIVAHYAHIPLGLAMLAGLALFYLLRRLWRPVFACAAVFVAAVLLNTAISLATPNSSGPSVAPSRYPILLARSIEDGPARQYLEDVCPEASYALCEIYSEFPRNVGAALWGEDSIFKRATPEQARRIGNEEMTVLWGAFKAYPLQQMQALVSNAWKQLFMIGLADAKFVELHVEGSTTISMTDSKQGEAVKSFAEHLQLLTIAIALAGLLLFGRQLQMPYRLAIAIMLVGLAINAAICGGLSAPAPRYQGRIIWCLVLAGLTAFALRVPLVPSWSRVNRTHQLGMGSPPSYLCRGGS